MFLLTAVICRPTLLWRVGWRRSVSG